MFVFLCQVLERRRVACLANFFDTPYQCGILYYMFLGVGFKGLIVNRLDKFLKLSTGHLRTFKTKIILFFNIL